MQSIIDVNLYVVTSSFVIGTIAVIWDLKFHKIPNWLTLPGIVFGIAVNLFFNFKGWYIPVFGLVVGFLLLLIPFALGGIAGGDIKLLMALGAILGPKAVLWITLIGGVAGGLISILTIFRRMGFSNGIFRIYMFFCSIIGGSKKSEKILSNNADTKLYIPYGLAIYLGLIFVLIWKP